MRHEHLSVLRQFLKFAAVGVVGFVVDAGALLLLLHATGMGPYLCRVGSFLCAATVTWYLNRTYTFSAGPRASLTREWLQFLGTNAIGGVVNFAVYSGLVAFVGLVSAYPVIGVAAGSLAGLGVNFTLSRAYIFRDRWQRAA